MMKNIEALVRARRSVRSFDGAVAGEDLEKIRALMADIDNPYGLSVEYKLLDAEKQKLGCPVVVGTEMFIGAKMKAELHFNEAVGYSFEKLLLGALSLGIGSVWICGTMDRTAFEKAMELGEGEVMPCISPLGYPAKKMSLRESMMRKAIKADERLPFEELFFRGGFDCSLSYEAAGALGEPLRMVQLAPSAVNKQPWRIVVADNAAHFYLKRSKGYAGGTIDIQKIDIGIALCHFELAAREAGLEPRFTLAEPENISAGDMEYIASYLI